jgi:hypothetical protein
LKKKLIPVIAGIAVLGGGGLASASAPKLKLHVAANCDAGFDQLQVSATVTNVSLKAWRRLRPQKHGATLRVNGKTYPLTLDSNNTQYEHGRFASISFQPVQSDASGVRSAANKRATVSGTSTHGMHTTLHKRADGVRLRDC